MIGDIEKGRVANPGIGTVAEYLRACRASFADLKDILDAYTRQRTLPEQAGRDAVEQVTQNLPRRVASEVTRYDAKTSAARKARGEMPEQAAGRQLRAQKLARHALLRERLRQHVTHIINLEHLDRNWEDRRQLLEHARRLYGIMNRTRGSKAEERARLLDKARAWLAEQNLVPSASLDRVQEAVVVWYEKLEKTGGLDRLPAVSARPDAKAGRKSLVRREREKAMEPLNAYLVARHAAVEQLWSKAQELLLSEGVAPEKHRYYRGLLKHICYAVDHHVPDSDPCRRLIEEYVTGALFKALPAELPAARRIAAALADSYDEVRRSLPPDPRGWGRPA
jgi:hypothetical protein